MHGWQTTRGEEEDRSMYRFAPTAIILSLLFFGDIITATAQSGSAYKLPAGTRLKVRLEVDLSSRVASVGDTFAAYVTRPVANGEMIMVPDGTAIEARVTSVERAGAGRKYGQISVRFERLKLPSGEIPIIADLVAAVKPKGLSRIVDAVAVIGGMTIGALIGGSQDGGQALAIGAGVGAAAGAGLILIRSGNDAVIRQSEEFEIVLKKDAVLPVADY
jgi:hypothetical protein